MAWKVKRPVVWIAYWSPDKESLRITGSKPRPFKNESLVMCSKQRRCHWACKEKSLQISFQGSNPPWNEKWYLQENMLAKEVGLVLEPQFKHSREWTCR